MKNKVFKILNLYACLGGNRYKWNEVASKFGINIEVVAVELDNELADLYKERFPSDVVVIADAHQYMIDNYKEFDFIWSSPPCQTHSRVRHSQKNRNSFKPLFPDLKLYEEIIFLKNFFKGKYCVENVIPYYTPLIPGLKRGRHLYWTNFPLPLNLGERELKGVIGSGSKEVEALSDFHHYDFLRYNGKQRRDKIARNLVDYEAGKMILDAMFMSVNKKTVLQKSFDLFTN